MAIPHSPTATAESTFDYKKIADAAIKQQAKALGNVPDADIRATVARIFSDPARAKKMADLLGPIKALPSRCRVGYTTLAEKTGLATALSILWLLGPSTQRQSSVRS